MIVRVSVVLRRTVWVIARILQPYNIRVTHKPITTSRQLLTNVKDKDEPNDRRGAVYKIKCCDCQATYIGETGRNLNVRLTEHKRATRNGEINNHIAEHHLKTNHRIDWDSAECVTYSTDYYQRITLESWFTNLEQTPLNRCQQLPAPYKRLIADNNKDRQTIDKPTYLTNNRPTDIWLTKDGSKRTNHIQQSSQPITSRLNWQTTNNITRSSTNQDNDQRLVTSTDNSQFTWLWWWLPLRLSKRQSMSPQTVLSGLHSPGRSQFTELWEFSLL